MRPARIYAPGEAAGRAEGRRPRQTAGSIAEALGIGVGLEHREGQEKELANQLSVLGPNSPALVVWEHSAILDIVGHLDGPVRPKVKSWPDGRYDVVLVCRADKSGSSSPKCQSWSCRRTALPRCSRPRRQPPR